MQPPLSKLFRKIHKGSTLQDRFYGQLVNPGHCLTSPSPLTPGDARNSNRTRRSTVESSCSEPLLRRLHKFCFRSRGRELFSDSLWKDLSMRVFVCVCVCVFIHCIMNSSASSPSLWFSPYPITLLPSPSFTSSLPSTNLHYKQSSSTHVSPPPPPSSSITFDYPYLILFGSDTCLHWFLLPICIFSTFVYIYIIIKNWPYTSFLNHLIRTFPMPIPLHPSCVSPSCFLFLFITSGS